MCNRKETGHEEAEAQADLMVIRTQAVLVEVRTMLVSAARGFTKFWWKRLGSCGTGQIREELARSLSKPLQNALKPLMAEVESVSERIRGYDEQIENIAKSRYPETALLQYSPRAYRRPIAEVGTTWEQRQHAMRRERGL